MQTPQRPPALQLLLGHRSGLWFVLVRESNFGIYFVWEESMSLFLWAQEISDGVLLNKVETESKWEFSGLGMHWGE